MCCGSAKWKREEVPDHKFDFIDVRDFRNNGFFQQFKYVFLFLMVIKSFAVYVADIYTAITLLAFGHFSGGLYEKVQNDPDNNFQVPISYGRWIFTGCIIFSFLLLAYEAHKSRAIVKSRDISYAYTNVMANNYYSLRSYDHYCFFSHINDSTKKVDELAFFIFFTFKGWKRLLVADGPRQVINFFTLYGLGSFAKWSTNPYDYYEGNVMTGIMILSMLFTVAVFAGSLILLIIASVMYIPLLCYIKGNLKEFCCHKIDKRITELVHRKKKQRLAKVAEIAKKEAAGDFSHLMNKKGEMIGRAIPQPTLPNVDVDLLNDEKSTAGVPLQRTNSASSSTVVHGSNGIYGLASNYKSPGMGPSHFYGNHAPSTQSFGYNDKEYSSTAKLVSNAGPAGGEHAYMNQDGVETLIDHMGPIGTSPMLFAQRLHGPGRFSPAPGGAFADPYGQQGGQRTLFDPVNRGSQSSPGFGPQRFAPSPSPYDNDSASLQQSPFQQPLRVQGHGAAAASANPYAAGGLDYPPPTNNHGVEGLDFPPPTPPDISSFVPYGGHEEKGGFYQPTIDVSAPASSTVHSGPGQMTMVGQGTDGFGAELHPGSHTGGGSSGRNSVRQSFDPHSGVHDEIYDAYLNSHTHSPAITPERRHSYMMSDYPSGAQDWPSQQYSPHDQHYGMHQDGYGGGDPYMYTNGGNTNNDAATQWPSQDNSYQNAAQEHGHGFSEQSHFQQGQQGYPNDHRNNNSNYHY